MDYYKIEQKDNITVVHRGAPVFIKIFVDKFFLNQGVLTDKEFRLFILLALKMNWYNNQIKIDFLSKYEFRETLGIAEKTFRNLLCSLHKKGFISRVAPRTYELNLEYVSRQSSKPSKKKDPYD